MFNFDFVISEQAERLKKIQNYEEIISCPTGSKQEASSGKVRPIDHRYREGFYNFAGLSCLELHITLWYNLMTHLPFLNLL